MRTLSGLRKRTAEAVHQEITREVEQLLHVVFQGRRKTGHVDLEALETAARSAMHRAGAAALSELLRFPAPAAQQRSILCTCGHQTHYRELRTKPVLTAVGAVSVSRPYYLCPHCHIGQFPADAELDIENTESSPAVRRMHALVGQQGPFDHGREQLKVLAGLEVTTKAVEPTVEVIGHDIAQTEEREIQRAVQLDLPIVVGEPIPILYAQMDGAGVPVVKKQTEGRKGKTEGQPAHTREAKLGSVFTQTGWDQEGYPVRDLDSTTYTGAIETAEEFGKRLYVEAWERGWSRAGKKVVMGDGAEWAAGPSGSGIWPTNIFPARCRLSISITLASTCGTWLASCTPHDEAGQKAWMKLHPKQLLDKGEIEKPVHALRSLYDTHPEMAGKIRTEAEYFERNAERTRYPTFRRQHLFVGSGVIEAGCKTAIGSRVKRSGMFWTVRGANAILALRCCHVNARFEDYGDSRRAA